jgi:hypothetical protein
MSFTTGSHALDNIFTTVIQAAVSTVAVIKLPLLDTNHSRCVSLSLPVSWPQQP